jgi:hypothetical protein
MPSQPNQASRVQAAGTLYQIKTALNLGDAPLLYDLLSDLVRLLTSFSFVGMYSAPILDALC